MIRSFWDYCLHFMLLVLLPFHLVSGLIQSGYEILDLQSTTNMFEDEASSWLVSPNMGSSASSQCSTAWLLGGFGVVGTAETSLTRSYVSLPPHDMIFFTVEVWLVDLTFPGSSIDLFAFYFDEILVQDWTIVSSTLMYSGNKCGGPTTDYYATQVYGQVPHNQNELNLKIVKMANPTNNFTVGFRSLQLSLKTSSESTLICKFKDYSGTDPSCECFDGWYDNPSSSFCSPCNSACTYCFGSALSDCLGCKNGHYFDGQSCGTCHSTCERCNGTLETDCVKCPTRSYLHPNSTCQTSCNAPMEIVQQANGSICQAPCSTGYFALWTNSCVAQCESPLKSETNSDSILLCHLPCNESLGEYYSPESQTCVNGCTSPYVIKQADAMKICVTPPSSTPDEAASKSPDALGQLINNVKEKINNIGSAFRPNNPNSVFMVAIAKLIRYVIYIQVPILDDVRQALQSSNSSIFSLSTTFSYPMPQSLKGKFSSQPVPAPFNEGITTASYLYNNWEPISTYLILFFLGIAFTLLEYLAIKTKIQVLIEILRRFRILTRWNFVLIVFFNSYDNLTLYSILEFRTLQFDSILSIISFITCVCLSLVGIFLLWILYKATREACKIEAQAGTSSLTAKEAPLTYLESCQVLYIGFKHNKFLKQGCLLFQTIRIIVYYIFVGLVHGSPLIQTTQLTLLSLVMLFYLIKERPFKDKFNLFVTLVYEILILIVNVSLMSLAILDAAGDLKYEYQLIFSYIILIVNTAIQFCSNIFTWVYVLLGAKAAYRASKKGLRGKTTWIYAPLGAYESPGMDFKFDTLYDQNNPRIAPLEASNPVISQAKQSIAKRRFMKIETQINSPSSTESDAEFTRGEFTNRNSTIISGFGDQTNNEDSKLTSQKSRISSASMLKLRIKKLLTKGQSSKPKIFPTISTRHLSDIIVEENIENLDQEKNQTKGSNQKQMPRGTSSIKKIKTLQELQKTDHKETVSKDAVLTDQSPDTPRSTRRLLTTRQNVSIILNTPKDMIEKASKILLDVDRLPSECPESVTNRGDIMVSLDSLSSQAKLENKKSLAGSVLISKWFKDEESPIRGLNIKKQKTEKSLDELNEKEIPRLTLKVNKPVAEPNSMSVQENNISSLSNIYSMTLPKKGFVPSKEASSVFLRIKEDANDME